MSESPDLERSESGDPAFRAPVQGKGSARKGLIPEGVNPDRLSQDDGEFHPDHGMVALMREGFRALSLGWDLAIPIFGGVLLGSFLDRWLGTGHIFTLGLLMLGVMTSYYNLGRVIQRMRRIDQARVDEEENGSEEGGAV